MPYFSGSLQVFTKGCFVLLHELIICHAPWVRILLPAVLVNELQYINGHLLRCREKPSTRARGMGGDGGPISRRKTVAGGGYGEYIFSPVGEVFHLSLPLFCQVVDVLAIFLMKKSQPRETLILEVLVNCLTQEPL